MTKRSGRVGWVRNYQDFRSIEYISPGAALLMAAEYDRVRKLTGTALSVVDIQNWQPEVYSTLAALGFFDLLELPNVPRLELPEGFFIQRLASEAAANSRPAIDQIIDLFEKAGGNEELRFSLCGAVIDALENVRDHAYPQKEFQGVRHVPNWWFTGASHRDERSVTLCVYDQGITIPVSLPNRFGMAAVSEAFANFFGLPFDASASRNDGQAIDTAMRLSASSTQEAHRGKGLAKIHEVVSRCKGGRLLVVSRCGEYLFTHEKGVEVRNHNSSLPGTYLEISALFD